MSTQAQVEQPEINSPIIERWFEELPFEAKLAAAMLNSLLNSESERLSSIGKDILKQMHNDVISLDNGNEGDSTVEKMTFREMYLILNK